MNRLPSKMFDWLVRILILLISIWDMIFVWEIERSKCDILNMRICNGDRNLFVILELSLHDWLRNKSKSCKDFIQDNYDNNYISWSLKNLLSEILFVYINLNCSIRDKSIDWFFFHDRSIVDSVDLCELLTSDRFSIIKSIFSWQST